MYKHPNTHISKQIHTEAYFTRKHTKKHTKGLESKKIPNYTK